MLHVSFCIRVQSFCNGCPLLVVAPVLRDDGLPPRRELSNLSEARSSGGISIYDASKEKHKNIQCNFFKIFIFDYETLEYIY